MDGLSRLFSFWPWKHRQPWHQSAVPGSLLLFYNAQRIWSHFCGISSFTKNTNATLRAQVTWASKICLWIFDACFTQITSSKIERSFGFDRFVFFSLSSISYDCRTQSNSIHELSSIEVGWVGFKSSSIRFDLLCRAFFTREFWIWFDQEQHIL